MQPSEGPSTQREFRYAFNNVMFGSEDIATSIARVAAAGYDAIELVADAERFGAQRIRGLASDAGIAVSTICPRLTPDTDFSSPDATIRQQAFDYISRLADFAAEVGAESVIVAPTPCPKLAPEADPVRERALAVEGIRAAGEYAASVGVNLLLEAWNRYETYMLNRQAESVAFWRETGLTNGGILADLFHLNIEEASIADALREVGPLLAHVHLADSGRELPGTGHVDFAAVLSALEDIGYAGYLSFEMVPRYAMPGPFGKLGAPSTDLLDRFTREAIRRVAPLER